MKLYLFIQLFMVGALLQGFGSLAGAASQNVNINKSIKAQQDENQKNREYNLQLAKMQNEWNLQQWERENEYNNPLNVMARLKTAKLNPNLIYGSGANSVSAPSPSLTSGAPSSPVDMSLMAQRPTVGQIMNNALQIRSTMAQIKNVEADTERKTLDNDVQKELKDFLGLEFKDVDYVNQYLFSPQAQKYIVELRNLYADNFEKTLDNQNKSWDNEKRALNIALEKEVSTKEWESLSNIFDKSIQECKEFVANAALRLRGLKADVSYKEGEASWNDPSMIEKLPEGLPMLVKILRQVLGK